MLVAIQIKQQQKKNLRGVPEIYTSKYMSEYLFLIASQ